MHDKALIEFARDVSGDDPKIMAKVRGFIATPPTTIEDVGFYGPLDGPVPRRQFLATVSALSEAGHLLSSEDKYSNELIPIMVRDGHIKLADLPPAARKFWELVEYDPEEMSQRAFRKFAWESYGPATQAIEAQLAARGKALLSIDATDGDTMFFAIVDRVVADRWRGVGLGDFPDYDGGVRDPMWDRYWSFLAYAVGERLVIENKNGFPPGTRRRDSAAKLASFATRP